MKIRTTGHNATVTITPKDDAGRYITEEQIDAAWEFNEDSSREIEAHGRAILYTLGIVTCPKCGGRGDVTWQYWDTQEPVVYTPCPACHRNGLSHGWILNPEHQPPASGDAEPEGDADAPE